MKEIVNLEKNEKPTREDSIFVRRRTIYQYFIMIKYKMPLFWKKKISFYCPFFILYYSPGLYLSSQPF